MNTLTHFEIPSNDIKKTKEFYSSLFNWEFNFIEEMNYMMFTIPADQTNAPVGGGILQKQNEQHSVTNYITVDNVKTKGEKIVKLGGKIIVPKTPVPGMGWFIHFADLDGNTMAIWENDKEAK